MYFVHKLAIQTIRQSPLIIHREQISSIGSTVYNTCEVFIPGYKHFLTFQKL